MKQNFISLSEEEVPRSCLETVREVDFSDQIRQKSNGTKKEVKSVCLDYTYSIKGKEVTEVLWKALKSDGSVYWTNSVKSPQIINIATNRGRGNLAFINGDVGKMGGRPKGASTRITAKQVCDNLGMHPSELYAAIALSDPNLCRKYGIKDLKTISIKNKMDAAKELYSRLEGIAKSNQLDASGNIVDENGSGESETQLQIYIPKSHHHEDDITTIEFNTSGDEDE